MRTIALVSSHAGTGKTTVAVNAAKGLERRGYRVILHGVGHIGDLCDRLGQPSINNRESFVNLESGQVIKSLMGVDVFLGDKEKSDLPHYDKVHALLEKQGYDYLILDTDNQNENIAIAAALADIIIACTDLAQNDEPQQLAHLNELIKNRSGLQKCINLIVPCKINTKEWTNNSHVLFSIADQIGYENIADIIPACERIHLLSYDHKHVWDLTQKNIQCVFDSLVSRLVII